MPLLNVFFDASGFSVDTTQHLSLGTSLATILFIPFPACWRTGAMVPCAPTSGKDGPGIIAGTLRRASRSHLPGLFLRGFFAFFVMLVGVHLFSTPPLPQDRATRTSHSFRSATHRPISSLAGIAGTMLYVIFLSGWEIDWADAVTSVPP